MVSHRAINDVMQTPKKEVHLFFFSVCWIVFNCSWQSIMFDKNQKSCIKPFHLVTDDGLYNRKAFYKVQIVFINLHIDVVSQMLWLVFDFLVLLYDFFPVRKNVYNLHNTKLFDMMQNFVKKFCLGVKEPCHHISLHWLLYHISWLLL